MLDGIPAQIVRDEAEIVNRQAYVQLHSKTTKDVRLILLFKADLIAKLIFDGTAEEWDGLVLVVELRVRVAGDEIVLVGQPLAAILLLLHGAPVTHSSVHVQDAGVDRLGQLAATALDHGERPEDAARPLGLDVVAITGEDDVEPFSLMFEDVLVQFLVRSLAACGRPEAETHHHAHCSLLIRMETLGQR